LKKRVLRLLVCKRPRRRKQLPPLNKSSSRLREAAAQDHDRMLAELRREVGRLVVDTTSKVTGKILSADDQKRLADETSKQLAA